MGYAGYTKAKLPPPPPTAVQAALLAVQSQDSLDVMDKLTRNVAVNPTEEKYRRVRLSNGKVKAALVDMPGALDALLAMGWVRDGEGEEAALVVPKGRFFTMADVRQIDEAKESLKRRARDAARAKSAAKVPTGDMAAQIRAQMEADRRERAAREPITKGSAAQRLPDGGGSTCKDIGIGDDCKDC